MQTQYNSLLVKENDKKMHDTVITNYDYVTANGDIGQAYTLGRFQTWVEPSVHLPNPWNFSKPVFFLLLMKGLRILLTSQVVFTLLCLHCAQSGHQQLKLWFS
jgi:hypothetical protein